MKLNTMLIGGFLIIVLLLGVLAYLGVSETNAVKNKIAISTASKDIMMAVLSDNVNLHHSVEAKDLNELTQLSEEGKEQDELTEMWFEALGHGTDSAEFKESDAYKTWVKGDYEAKGKSVEYIPEIAKMAEEAEKLWENCEEVEGGAITARQEVLAAKARFDEEYPKEKEKRHALMDRIYLANDAQLNKIIGSMIYYSKEALYQYGDQQHIDEWLSAIQALKTEATNSTALTSDENRNSLLKYLDEYYPIAETMADLTLEMKQKEAEASAKLAVFHENATKMGEKRESVDLAAMALMKEATERMLLIMLSFTIMTLVLAILIGFFISRSISKPIKKLTDVVDEISKGRLDVSVEKSNIYEVNKLTEALDRVLTTMKRSIKRLDDKDNKKE